jgi:lipid-A-disaccharide synthase
MAKALKLFILAGEPSGDRIGADLVERLKSRVDLEILGVGGEALTQSGLKSEFDMNELSVMGWADVLPRLPKLLWRARQVAQKIIHSRPDVAVLIDAQVFSSIVAGQVLKAAPDIPVILYVAPAVWAWKPERAAKLSPKFREVLSVLPFEPEFMATVGGPETTYVGHPALQRFPLRTAVPDTGPVLLLPGSREGELRRHLPLMRAVAEGLKAHERVSGFLLPTPRSLEQRVRREVAGWEAPVEVITGEALKARAFDEAIAAAAVTGTVTLELALAGVPMATTYVADKGQAKRWVQYKVEFASLPNAILGRGLVPEVLQVEADSAALVAEVRCLLEDRAVADAQVAGFGEIRRLMEEGTPAAPRVDPAERVMRYVK